VKEEGDVGGLWHWIKVIDLRLTRVKTGWLSISMWRRRRRRRPSCRKKHDLELNISRI